MKAIVKMKEWWENFNGHWSETYMKIIELLLSSPIVDVNHQNKAGKTALMLAMDPNVNTKVTSSRFVLKFLDRIHVCK